MLDMDYKEYEGFKKIENSKEYTLEQLYDVIKKYQDVTGEVKYAQYDEELKIVVDVDRKYYIDIYLKDKYIVIERKLEAGAVEDSQNIMEESKSLALAHVDRMIDQIYDLLKEYVTTGKITEHITKAKKILYVEENKRLVLKGAISLGKIFDVRDENNKPLYEIKQNVINQIFSIQNLESTREEASLNYKNKEQNKYVMLKSPYEVINLKKDENSTKTKYISELSNKQLEITADFTDNHYLVELNKIVIGSIDCLDPDLKQRYRIEINNLEYTYILLCTIALIDTISKINM